MPDPQAVQAMFGRIAGRYDAANRALSAGVDVYWRHRLVRQVRRTRPIEVLDVATGSGDVAFALRRGLSTRTRITGMDFCEPMLDRARAKQLAAPRNKRAAIRFVGGDALNLDFADASFDAVTIAFGLRNMADRARCLKEMRRVLRGDGHLYVLEFSQPWALVRPLYYLYLTRFSPFLAGLFTGDRAAYRYLGDSIRVFPDTRALSAEIRGAGFSGVRVARMTFGVVALHHAWR